MRPYLTRFFGALDRLLFPQSEFPERSYAHLNLPAGLDSPEARVIYALAYGSQSSSMIAARLGDAIAETEQTLDGLVHLGLVRFRPEQLSSFYSEDEANIFGMYELTSLDTRRTRTISEPQPNL